MMYKFCPECGDRLVGKEVKNPGWELKYKCDCGIQVHITFGDAMGGSKDVVDIRRVND